MLLQTMMMVSCRTTCNPCLFLPTYCPSTSTNFILFAAEDGSNHASPEHENCESQGGDDKNSAPGVQTCNGGDDKNSAPGVQTCNA